jgi:hypothetical protein
LDSSFIIWWQEAQDLSRNFCWHLLNSTVRKYAWGSQFVSIETLNLDTVKKLVLTVEKISTVKKSLSQQSRSLALVSTPTSGPKSLDQDLPKVSIFSWSRVNWFYKLVGFVYISFQINTNWVFWDFWPYNSNRRYKSFENRSTNWIRITNL